MRKLVVFLIIFLVSAPLLFYFSDIFFAPDSPEFKEAPGIFCETRFEGITLPPFGIYLCPESFEDESLRGHELAHWGQYKQYGSFDFYLRYFWGMIEAGFRYDDHPMEVDARQRASEFMGS